MKTGISNSTISGNESPTKGIRYRFSVFFVFIIFSSLVWVVIKLSKDFTSSVTYKIEYQNIPAGHILVGVSDTTITAGIDAQGFNLVKQVLFKKKPVVNIDLSTLKTQENDGVFRAILLTSGLTRKIASQIGSHRELIYISPDTLKFEFIAEYKRKVPVIPKVQYQLRAQYMLYEPVQVSPDSIWVYGPKEMVDTIASVNTEVRNIVDLFEDQSIKINLYKPPYRQITYSDAKVEVALKVEKFTEKAFELPVRIIYPESNFILRIFPETVVVNCLVALKDYKRVDPAMFEAAVTYIPSEYQTSTKLKVELLNYPSYVRISRIEPERVEYILVKSAQ